MTDPMLVEKQKPIDSVESQSIHISDDSFNESDGKIESCSSMENEIALNRVIH